MMQKHDRVPARRSAKDEVRGRLLEAGVETFRRMGFNGCGVQDITDSAGVPKGSFYNHFESKEALGAEALEHYWKEGACSTLRILSDETIPPVERLRQYFQTMADRLAENEFTCGCLVGNLAAEMADHSKLISDRLSSIFAGWTQAVANCIRDGQRLGQIRADARADSLAAFLLNAWEGATLRARMDKDGAALSQFINTAFTTLLK
jgi:TetR/AcrR family transcriptional repressor of nem operon